MAEYFDVVDENGIPTGEIVERTVAHTEGIRHRTSHVWLVRKNDGAVQVLLQKRSLNKDSFPGCYDISSAGHIPAGVDYKASAVREAKEELGITIVEEELIYCGDRKIQRDEIFHGKPFRDNQCSRVFCIWRETDEEAYVLQKEELESVRWMNLDECIQGVKEHAFPNCLSLEELEMVRRVAV